MNESPWALAAKSIRAELTDRYPQTKFRVRSQVFANGTAVNVMWVGGPSREELTPLVAKYEEGAFDAMTDSYVRNENPQRQEFRRLRGSVKYVTLVRREM